MRFRADFWSLPDEPLLGFVEIPEGVFTMGSDKSRDPAALDEELPQHRVTLSRYYMARYEVTVAQFRAFVSADKRDADENALKGPDDNPVRGVSWHDALSYTTWLDGLLRRENRVPPGLHAIVSSARQSCRVTLPSEGEWEKAARGVDGRIYPWGDKSDRSKANHLNADTGSPTPVGSYPEGASPYGLLDMSGNVWEWTRSVWGPDWEKPVFSYPYQPADPRREDLVAPDAMLRVVRGGSFNDGDHHARTGRRVRLNPDGGLGTLGFRVVVSCLRS